MNHQHFLALAAQAAAKIDPHQTSPNPRVGCVVVKNQQVIATGAHQHFGQAHAEVLALANLSENLTGSTVYVTLEPCIYYPKKQTPACSEALINAQPDLVVVGALDPNFPGYGVAALQKAGIKTLVLKSNFHTQLNPWFNIWVTQKRPFITLKVAQTLDGKITNGQKHITNSLSRQQVHFMRTQHSAILTTTATVLADNPFLNVRLSQPLTHPVSHPNVIVMGHRNLPPQVKQHQVTGRKIHYLQSHNFGELKDLCLNQGYSSILTECGGTLNSALLNAGLVDKIELFLAPYFTQKKHLPSFTSTDYLHNFKLSSTAKRLEDLHLTYTKNR